MKKYTASFSFFFSLLLFVVTPGLAVAEVDLHDLFTDHMVLQRNRPIPVWGKANPGQEITVSINDTSRTTSAGDEGHWRLDLPAMNAGGPYTLTVEGSNKQVLKDVLVGEVWLCSGQSNMEWPLKGTREARKKNAVKNAKFDGIRLFELPRMASKTPLNRLKKSVKWTRVRPKTIKQFSAVGYFFGRRLHQVLSSRNNESIPIGLIQCAWGGSKAEAWTSRSALMSHPQLRSLLSNMEDAGRTRHTPTLLHNAMIRPLIPFAIRGAI